MTDLHTPLDDLLAEVPSYVVPDARAAWAAGGRRRTRRRIGVTAVVVVLVALAAGLVNVLPRSPDVPPADGERGGGVDGYPSRIEKPWFLRDLPDRPGAIAGLLNGDGDVLAVSPTGSVWRLPQDDGIVGHPIAVSADGTRVAYLADHDTFVLRDLVGGGTTVARDVGDGTFRGDLETHDTDHRYAVSGQAPAFFSPGGDAVFVLGGPTAPTDRRNGALLIGVDGSASFVEGPHSVGRDGGVWPAGWTASGDLVWLDVDFLDQGRPRWARAVVTDTTARRLRVIDLAVPHRLRGVSQWTGAVSPDGELIALTSEESSRTFVMSLRSGEQVGEVVASNYGTICPVSWAGNDPRSPWAGAEVTLLVDERDRPLVQADPALRALCATWATDALSGDRHRGVGARVFGTDTGWLSWHWREVLLAGGLAALGLAAAGVVLFRRRRTRGEG